MRLPSKPSKKYPIRLRCTKAPRCKRGGYIAWDDLMHPRTATVFQPCDKHEENGYYDLQIRYEDKDGKDITHLDPHRPDESQTN